MKRVVCVGECMLELSHDTDRALRLGFAGDTYNTAVYLRRVADDLGLCAEIGYVTGLGLDPYSAAIRDAWREEGIADLALTSPDRVPGLYAIRTAPDGERSFTYWRSESAARAVLSGTAFCRALRGDLVHLSGITLQLTSRESRAALLAHLRSLREAGTLVSFDTNYRPAGWASTAEATDAIASMCAEADIVLTSREDEAALHGPEAPEQAVRRLAARGRAEVLLRAGADGAYVGVGGVVRHLATDHVDSVVDTTAAGDAWDGAYLAARLAGRSPSSAAALGNTAARLVIQHAGAVIPREIALLPDLV